MKNNAPNFKVFASWKDKPGIYTMKNGQWVKYNGEEDVNEVIVIERITLKELKERQNVR